MKENILDSLHSIFSFPASPDFSDFFTFALSFLALMSLESFPRSPHLLTLAAPECRFDGTLSGFCKPSQSVTAFSILITFPPLLQSFWNASCFANSGVCSLWAYIQLACFPLPPTEARGCAEPSVRPEAVSGVQSYFRFLRPHWLPSWY